MYISTPQAAKTSYRPGLNRYSHYKNIWYFDYAQHRRRHWHGFKAVYNERYAEIYGPLTAPAVWEVCKLIIYGSYLNDFQRHTCPDCGTVLIVPFMCKSRLCLSCYRKKIFGWSIHLSYIMNQELSHFHVTFTLPGEVRKRLFERGFRLEIMIKEAAKACWKVLRSSAGDLGKELSAGIVATIHTCGNCLKFF